MPQEIDGFWSDYADFMPNFCLFDDLFMSVCFNNDPLFTEQILRVIMENDDLRVLEARAQVDLTNLIGRSVRLDVKAKDAEGHPINIEIQRDSSKAIPRRARYHSSMLDAVTLKKRQDFKDLPECYVIFITEHDVLGRKLPIYHIDRVIKETSDDFGDGSHILYVNGENRDNTQILLIQLGLCTVRSMLSMQLHSTFPKTSRFSNMPAKLPGKPVKSPTGLPPRTSDA